MAKLSVAVTDQDHSRGEMSAPVTLVEYGDFQCPHCAMAHALVTRLERHYGEKLRFVYRNFPLVEIHPLAEPAAEAAEFAAAGGKFWEMHDSIFAHQRQLSESMLTDLAGRLGLDEREAGSAIEEHQFGGPDRGRYGRRGEERRSRDANVLYQWRAVRGVVGV